jgi:uncharacterized protein YjbI with pentapeptide repeats
MIPHAPKLAGLEPLASPQLQPALSLEAVDISGLVWTAQTARQTNFDSLRLSAPELTQVKLRDSGWVDVEIRGGILAGADLTGSSLRRMAVVSSRADGLIVADSTGRDLSFSDAKLDLANCRLSRWQRVVFAGCSLREADFGGATLQDVSFKNCDLTGADFSGAHLTAVDLRSSTLTGLQGLAGLAGAIIDHAQLIGLSGGLAHHLGITVD